MNNDKLDLDQIKYECFFSTVDAPYSGMPINFSVDLRSKFDIKSRKRIWIKTILCSFISYQNINEKETRKREEKLENSTEIIKRLEEIDLRNLKNNYFTDFIPEKFSRWELTYNHYFKVVGTFDREVEEIKEVSKILDVKKIMDSELNKENLGDHK